MILVLIAAMGLIGPLLLWGFYSQNKKPVFKIIGFALLTAILGISALTTITYLF